MRVMSILVPVCAWALTWMPSALPGQSQFEKVEIRTAFGSAEQGNKGKLLVDSNQVRFATNKGAQYFALPNSAIKEIYYSRVSGRRIKTAIAVSPLLLFSKGKKHYMTLSFNDGADLAGAVEFRLHKSNYRGVLRSVEAATGLTLAFDQEGVKDSEETVARRGEGENQTSLEVSSEPPGAEIEIDGAYVGSTPRLRPVSPGEHKVKIAAKGYRNWERKVSIANGETLKISAQLEEK